MIKIMANENDESWAINPAIIHETVRVAYQYLLTSYGNKKKAGKGGGEVFVGLPVPKKGEFNLSVIAWQISEWLRGNWTEHRVYYSLERRSVGNYTRDCS